MLLLQTDIDILKEIGLFKWLVYFLVISLVPVIKSIVSDILRNRRDAKIDKFMKSFAGMPTTLEHIRKVIYERYTGNISMVMVESILTLSNAANSLFLTKFCRDIIAENDLATSRKNIERDIHFMMQNLFSQSESFFSKFYYKNFCLVGALNYQWVEEMEKIIITGLYPNGKLTKRAEQKLYDNIRTELENIKFNVLAILHKL